MNDILGFLASHPWWWVLVVLVAFSFGPGLLVRFAALLYGPEDEGDRDEMLVHYDEDVKTKPRFERPFRAFDSLETAAKEGLGGRIRRRYGRATGRLSPLHARMLARTRITSDPDSEALLDYFREAGDFHFDDLIVGYLKRRGYYPSYVMFHVDDETCARLTMEPSWSKDEDWPYRRRPDGLAVEAVWALGHWHREPERSDGMVSNLVVCTKEDCDRVTWTAEMQASVDGDPGLAEPPEAASE